MSNAETLRLTKRTPSRCEHGARRGGEVAVPGADADHDVRLGGQRVGGGRAGRADRADRLRVVVRAAIPCRPATRRPGCRWPRRRRRARRWLGVYVTPPPATISGRAGGADRRDGPGEGRGLRHRSGDVPDPLGEQLVGQVVRLGLHVLRQRERHRTGLGRVGQDARRVQQRRRELLGTVDAIEVHRHGTEDVVDRDVALLQVLELLQDGAGDPGREGVTRQQQDRQPVDRRERGAGDHVGGTGADRGGDGHRGEPVALAGVRHCGVDHGLLVAAVEEPQVRRVAGELTLEQRLADARDVAVAEDAPAAREERLLDAVALGVLGLEEADGRLRDGQLGHAVPPNGRRGSTGWSAQVSRIQVWAGSSQISQARSGPGPAMTLR